MRFVLDGFDTTYGPSTPVLVELARRGRKPDGGGILVLADPLYESEGPAAVRESGAGGSAPRLLQSRREAISIVETVLDHELLLSSLTAIETHPGQGPQPLHADDGSIPLPRPYPPLAVVALWALTDFTEANGATRLVPGTHRDSRRPRPGEAADTVSAEMSAGSVLIYNGSIWHGGGANESDARRRFIVCNYCAGWVRQEENQLLGLDRDYVATLPPRMRRLVGYGVYRGLLGHVAGEDPGAWVDDAVETDLVWKRMR